MSKVGMSIFTTAIIFAVVQIGEKNDYMEDITYITNSTNYCSCGFMANSYNPIW